MLRPSPIVSPRLGCAQDSTPHGPRLGTQDLPASRNALGIVLARQPEDVLHSVLSHLNDEELGQVALRTQQAMANVPQEHLPHPWLAAITSTCRIRARAAGAQPALPPPTPNEELNWALIWSRHVRLEAALHRAHAAMTCSDYAGACVPLGNTALILALDALTTNRGDQAHKGAQRALALSAYMHAELACTPIARLVVGVAHARLGHVAHAEALLAAHFMPALDVFLAPGGGNGAYAFFGRARIHGSKPAEALKLLKDVAIETQSVALFDLFVAAASRANLPVQAHERETVFDLAGLYDQGHARMIEHIINTQSKRYLGSTTVLKMFLLDVPPQLPPATLRTPELEQRWAECRLVVQTFLGRAANA